MRRLRKWFRRMWARRPWASGNGGEEPWRDGYEIDTMDAKDGYVAFWTRDILLPTGPNVPRDDLEYIICEIRGDNLSRGLIIVYPAPRYSRIGFDPGRVKERPFPVPLAGPSFWEIDSDGATVWIKLDGKEIVRDTSRGYLVTHIIMAGPTGGRGFPGQWRPVK